MTKIDSLARQRGPDLFEPVWRGVRLNVEEATAMRFSIVVLLCLVPTGAFSGPEGAPARLDLRSGAPSLSRKIQTGYKVADVTLKRAAGAPAGRRPQQGRVVADVDANGAPGLGPRTFSRPGSGRSMVPEVDDEVLVIFLHGECRARH